MKPFDPSRCDLCGHSVATEVVRSNGKSMRSDWVPIPFYLVKVACQRCGLVRNGMAQTEFETHYQESYETEKLGEHLFYTADGPKPRSQVMADWLVAHAGQVWEEAHTALEVGAGAGALMQTLHRRFSRLQISGLELNQAVAAAGQGKGLEITSTPLETLPPGQFDIIYCIAVLEHVPSPTDFLQQLRQRLHSGGHLFLVQPTQDVKSYDILFADHVHHFSTPHLAQWARKTGYTEQFRTVGHPLMPNFSLHIWQAAGVDPVFSWQGGAVKSLAPAAAAETFQNMRTLDDKLTQTSENETLAVFGVSEVYWLTQAYSTLSNFPVAFGLDDHPERHNPGRFAFPIITPEAAASEGISEALLTMNTLYYPLAIARLEKLGIRAYPILTSRKEQA